MNIDVIGRVRNTKLPAAHGLMPLFEAIINSIHAIGDAGRDQPEIRILIDREPSLLSQDAHGNTVANITGFRILDNGIGFDSANYSSFDTLDSQAKAAQGGKGIGRLLWLKAFDKVQISSTFHEEGEWFDRTFTFLLSPQGIERHALSPHRGASPTPTTEVQLIGFRNLYRDASPKTADVIARRIVEHCLEHFLLNQSLRIYVQNSDEATHIDLHHLFESEFRPQSSNRTVEIGGRTFTIVDVFLKAGPENHHQLHLCAHNRVVQSFRLSGYIPHLDAHFLNDSGDPQVYNAYVSGDLLDEQVDAERTGFNIDRRDALSFTGAVVWEDLIERLIAEISSFLAPQTAQTRERTLQRVRQFVEEKEPRYRPLLTHRPQVLDRISSTMSDDKLDTVLYQNLSTWRHEVRTQATDRLRELPEEPTAFEQHRREFQRLIGELQEVAKSDLADYVIHRATVLSFFQKLLGSSNNGQFHREDAVHSLFFPQRKTSDQIDYDDHNLWVIDERLAYHQYLASDLPLSRQTAAPVASSSSDRPDILIYNAPLAFTPGDPPFASVVIVEFKRPERDDYDPASSPLRQVYRYIDDIKNGRARRADGSSIDPVPDVPFYCYVIATLTPRLRDDAKELGFIEAPDRRGFFTYNGNYRAYVEVSSYHKVLDDAMKRNRAFFDRLGIRPV